jgi:Spy/CpxP family protein refolding chaperone
MRGVPFTSSLGIGILVLGLAAAPVRAQQPGGKAAAPAGANAAAEAPRGHLWWNDDKVVAELSLTGEQRKRMDALLAKVKTSQEAAPGPMKLREKFHAALRQGKLDEARKALSEWAESEKQLTRAMGGLKLDVMSLLSAEQWTKVQAMQPNLAGVSWSPRASWQFRAREAKQPPPG